MKKYFILFVLLVTTTMLAGCSGKDSEVQDAEPDPGTVAEEIPLTVPDQDDPVEVPEVTDDFELALETEEETYPVGTEKINVIISNVSEETGGYGYHYSIERKQEDGIWEPVPLVFAVIEPYIFLEAGDSHVLEIGLFPEQYEYLPGEYRVVKNENGQELTAEFRLE